MVENKSLCIYNTPLKLLLQKCWIEVFISVEVVTFLYVSVSILVMPSAGDNKSGNIIFDNLRLKYFFFS